MLFNTIEYLLFLPFVFLLYWACKDKIKAQNFILLCASYFFYGCWDYRFLSLIVISSFADYTISLLIHGSDNAVKKKWLLFLSLFINLGFLFVFKYYNFFVTEFQDLLGGFDINPGWATLNVIIPVGISFYTFQTLSYTIDVYREKMEPTKNMLNFFVYVSFFPQLVAGPIERASNLLPQFEKNRTFDYDKAVDGLRQIIWGLFKKVVIADNCAVFVDPVFADYASQEGTVLIFAGILFIFQLYGDFSGYSDIAIGSSRLLGFDLMQNFRYPYHSKSITELWRRWHISLSTWFRDYLYTPIALHLRDRGTSAVIIAIIVTFTIIGIWHGANWTYMAFGILHALVLAGEALTSSKRKKYKKKKKKAGESIFLYNAVSWFFTMLFWVLTLIIFRSATLTDSLNYIKRMVYKSDVSFLTNLELLNINVTYLLVIIGFIIIMLLVEAKNQSFLHGLEKVPKNIVLRYSTYLALSLLIFQFFYAGKTFIYFQF